MANFYDALYDPSGTDYGNFGGNATPELTQRERRILSEVKGLIAEYNLPEDAKILEIGASVGFNHSCHPNYLGIEYSQTAVNIAKHRFGNKVPVIAGDATNLPIDSDSVDFIFSFATLEHIPRIDAALDEIDRVLAPGGLAYLAPAWNCRPWTVSKIEYLPYSELRFMQVLGRWLIPLREWMVVRFLVAFPYRIFDELFFRRLNGVRYRELNPDPDLINRFGHESDDDAFVSIDAHAAMMKFRRLGFEILSHNTFVKRIFCRGDPILIQKTGKHA